MNLFDYLYWRADVSLSASAFNPVDNLILAELCYTDLAGIVPPSGEEVSLQEARDLFFALHDREEVARRSSYTARAPFLMDSMCTGARFADTRLCFYEAVTDKDETAQFAAVTFCLPDGTAYVAFRGTDGTVVGWKEDFILSYRSGTKSQERAAEYLRRVGERLSCPLRLGGHSKGGNLAVYAASFAPPELAEQIIQVWSNDGPGFRDEIRALPGYRAIQSRTVSVIPDTSVIGLLLESDCVRHVVKSSASGLAQHDGFTWEVGPVDFIPAAITRTGAYLEKTVDSWVASLDDETLHSLVDSVFTAIEATGQDTFHAMSLNKMRTAEIIMTAIRSLPREKQRELLHATGRLVQSGGTAARTLLERDEEHKQQLDAANESAPASERPAEESDADWLKPAAWSSSAQCTDRPSEEWPAEEPEILFSQE